MESNLYIGLFCEAWTEGRAAPLRKVKIPCWSGRTLAPWVASMCAANPWLPKSLAGCAELWVAPLFGAAVHASVVARLPSELSEKIWIVRPDNSLSVLPDGSVLLRMTLGMNDKYAQFTSAEVDLLWDTSLLGVVDALGLPATAIFDLPPEASPPYDLVRILGNMEKRVCAVLEAALLRQGHLADSSPATSFSHMSL